MIEIDGSFGEGGGQVLRTALGLSAHTEKSFRIYNIRKNRSNPGLSPQHLKCVEILKELTNADVEGDELGSKKLVFEPNGLFNKDLFIDIGTAGSVTLLLQCILLILPKLDEEIEVKVKGGTDVKWSPSVDYFRDITLYFLNEIGLDCHIEIKKRGYYPKGGGVVVFSGSSDGLESFSFIDRGEIKEIRGLSFSSNLPNHVAKRQKRALLKKINKWRDIETNISVSRDSKALGKGSGVFVWAETENSRLGFSSLGEPGKPAEEVGEEAFEGLIHQIKKYGCIDRFMTDQFIPFLGIKGESEINAVEVTSHAETNAWVVSRFLDCEIEIKDDGHIIS